MAAVALGRVTNVATTEDVVVEGNVADQRLVLRPLDELEPRVLAAVALHLGFVKRRLQNSHIV